VWTVSSSARSNNLKLMKPQNPPGWAFYVPRFFNPATCPKNLKCQDVCQLSEFTKSWGIVRGNLFEETVRCC